MEIRYLAEFQVLAKCLNFTAAANQLYLTQPTLSKHIVSIEEELGTTLFIRTKQNVTLTETGKFLLNSSSKLLEHYNQMIADLASLQTGVKGTLRIGVLYYGMDELVLPVIHNIYLEFPQIQIEMRSGQPKDIIYALLDDSVDVIEMYRVPMPETESLCFQNITSVPFCAILPFSHPLAKRKSVSLSELNGESFIFARQQPAMNNYKRTYLADHGINIAQEYYTEHIDTIPAAVDRFQAIDLSLMHCAHKSNEHVAYIPVSDADFYAMMSYVWKPENINPCISSFIETVRKIYR